MDKRKRRNERSPGFNIGSASIIMVFSVLCLTLFAVLSLVTANSDRRLTLRAAEAVQDYYTAEYKAETAVLGIKKALDAGDSTAEIERAYSDLGLMMSDGEIRFVQPVDSRRELRVTLVQDGGRLEIVEWRLVANGDWNPDDGVQVWPG